MGPELSSMKQNADGERKTAIHEGGHCLLAYLLNKEGVYDNKPRKMTVVRRGGALGHVSFISDESSDENSQSLQSLRSHLVVGMGGRAAEAIFAGEEKVCTGASSDMNQERFLHSIQSCKTISGQPLNSVFFKIYSNGFFIFSGSHRK